MAKLVGLVCRVDVRTCSTCSFVITQEEIEALPWDWCPACGEVRFDDFHITGIRMVKLSLIDGGLPCEQDTA